MIIPEFMESREIELELTLEQLKSFVKTNISRDAEIVIRDNQVFIEMSLTPDQITGLVGSNPVARSGVQFKTSKIEVSIPLDALIPYELRGDKVVLKLPAPG